MKAVTCLANKEATFDSIIESVAKNDDEPSLIIIKQNDLN